MAELPTYTTVHVTVCEPTEHTLFYRPHHGWTPHLYHGPCHCVWTYWTYLVLQTISWLNSPPIPRTMLLCVNLLNIPCSTDHNGHLLKVESHQSTWSPEYCRRRGLPFVESGSRQWPRDPSESGCSPCHAPWSQGPGTQSWGVLEWQPAWVHRLQSALWSLVARH